MQVIHHPNRRITKHTIQLTIKPCKCDGKSKRNYARSSTRDSSDLYSGLQGQKTSEVILKLDLKLETRKKRGTFHAEGRMCTKQEDWESRSWLVPIY